MRQWFLFLALLTACVDRPVVPPAENGVDRVYRVRHTYLENTCDRDWWPESWTDLYEIRLRHDGLHDFAPYHDTDVGWPLTFEGVRIDHGTISHRQDWRSGTTGHFFTNEVSGRVVPNGLELDMVLSWENRDGTPCAQKARLTGERWDVGRPTADDGMYRVLVSAFEEGDGYVCDGQPQVEVPIKRYPMLVSRASEGAARIDFVLGGLRLRIPIVDGQVDFDGKGLAWYSFIGWTEVSVRAVGTFRPHRVDFDLKMWDSSGPSSCYYRYRIAGNKVLPGLKPTGEYRAVTLADDGCTGEPPAERDDTYIVIEQDGGWIELIGAFGLSTWLRTDHDGSFEATIYEGAGTATYDGAVVPGTLEFFYTFKSDSETRDCFISRDVQGLARFID